jgi:porin
MGIVPAASFTSDAAMNFRGGQNTAGSSFLHLTDVNLTLTSPLLPVAGSSVFLSFQHVNGTSPSEDVGDVQGVSSIDSDGRTQLSEAWYKQEFVDGKLAVTLGKIDAGSTMGLVEPEGYFINGYLGFQGVIPMPTYPDPSFGLQIMAAPTDRLTLDAGIYDGALQEDYRTGTLGPATLFGDPSDLFSIGQLTYALAPGRWTVTAGGWYHTGTFTDSLGDDQDGAYGLYLHTMLRLIVENPDAKDDNQGLSAFAHYGYSDPTGIDTPHHLGAGAVWVGALPGRNDDVAGLGLTSVIFRDGAEYTDTQETSVELFYKIQITPYLSVQPDLQYVINPGGNGASDAIVGTIRVSIDF